LVAKHIKEIDFKTVIVSPLRRTLQTAYHLLKDHPKFDEMKFVVHPGVREHVFGMSETTRFLGSSLSSCELPNLDTTPMEDENGRIDELFYTRGFQPELLERFKETPQDQIDEIIKEAISERFPRSCEYLEGTYDRVQEVKKQLKESNEKTLVVTHKVLLKFWTGKWDGMQRPFVSLPSEFASINNCELFVDPEFNE